MLEFVTVEDVQPITSSADRNGNPLPSRRVQISGKTIGKTSVFVNKWNFPGGRDDVPVVVGETLWVRIEQNPDNPKYWRLERTRGVVTWDCHPPEEEVAERSGVVLPPREEIYADDGRPVEQDLFLAQTEPEPELPAREFVNARDRWEHDMAMMNKRTALMQAVAYMGMRPDLNMSLPQLADRLYAWLQSEDGDKTDGESDS